MPKGHVGCPPSACQCGQPSCIPSPPAQNRWAAFIVRCERVNPCSGWRKVVPDEPFPIRDSQFDYPHIRILVFPTVQIVFKFHFIFSHLRLYNKPIPTSVRAGHTLEQNAKPLIIQQNDKNGAAITLALVQDHAEITAGLRGAKQARYFEVGREPCLHVQASAERRPAL